MLAARAMSARRALRRVTSLLLATVALTVGTSTVVAVVEPIAAYADSAGIEAQFIADMNAARQANGLQPYTVMSDLTAVARRHSADMAAKHSLYHNPSLTSDVSSWQAVGENVGEGPTERDIQTAFMQSPEHRANILDHDFTQVGVGVSVDGDGTIWVTEDFRQPMASAPAAPRHTSSGHSAATGATATTAPTTTGSTTTSTPTSAAPTVTPAPVVSPRAALLQRLRRLRHHMHAAASGDRVAQAFDYVRTLTQLAG